MNFLGAFFFFVFFNSLILSLFLMHKGKNGKAVLYLAFLLFIFSLNQLEFAAYWTNYLEDLPHLIFLTNGLPLLIGVFLYFYFRQTFGKNDFQGSDYLHFLPFVIHTIYMFPFYIKSAEFKLSSLQNIIYTSNPVFSDSFYIINSLISLHMIVYAILIRKNFSFSLLRPLKFYHLIYFGYLLYLIMDLVHLLEISLFEYEYIFTVDMIILGLCTLLVYTLIFKLFNSSDVNKIFSLEKDKYTKSLMTKEFIRTNTSKLNDLMENEKVFLDPDINLSRLSKQMTITNHQLSQLINEYFSKNFFDFINEYRIQEAKRRLHLEEQNLYTIESLAFDVGFNTKATFYNAFKKYIGMTPTEYIKRIRKLDHHSSAAS